MIDDRRSNEKLWMLMVIDYEGEADEGISIGHVCYPLVVN